MSAHVYKVIEIVGSSEKSSDDAIRRAVEFAAESVREMRWVEVIETRAHIDQQKIAHWQVKVRIGFTLEGS
ncbi:MAG: dodecin [Phycisphaerales bacterium]